MLAVDESYMTFYYWSTGAISLTVSAILPLAHSTCTIVSDAKQTVCSVRRLREKPNLAYDFVLFNVKRILANTCCTISDILDLEKLEIVYSR